MSAEPTYTYLLAADATNEEDTLCGALLRLDLPRVRELLALRLLLLDVLRMQSQLYALELWAYDVEYLEDFGDSDAAAEALETVDHVAYTPPPGWEPSRWRSECDTLLVTVDGVYWTAQSKYGNEHATTRTLPWAELEALT